jgi:hypothetical protein
MHITFSNNKRKYLYICTLDAAQDLLDLGAAAVALQVHRDLQLAHLCNTQTCMRMTCVNSA